MGLDFVDLILAFEDEFGISIDDRDAEKLVTPQLVTDYVVSRLKFDNKTKPNFPCITQSQFYVLRRILMKKFGILRQDIRPDTSVEKFIQGNTKQQKKQQWMQLDEELNHSLPLGNPILSHEFLFVLLFFSILSIQMKLGVFWLAAIVIAIPASAISTILLLMIISSILRPFSSIRTLGIRIPLFIKTVRDLLPFIRLPFSPEKHAHPDYVLHYVIAITSEQQGIPVEKIHPDSHFVKDLGID